MPADQRETQPEAGSVVGHVKIGRAVLEPTASLCPHAEQGLECTRYVEGAGAEIVIVGRFAAAVDPERVVYTVDVHDGWVNAEEREAGRHVKDTFTAMSPNDARRLAGCLINAAELAEKHARWRDE